MRQNINTIKPRRYDTSVKREDVESLPIQEIVIDIPLMRQVINDMEYNVGSRPTIPSCFEESTELGKVDKLTDIRVSNWDMLAEQCEFSRSAEPLKVEVPESETPNVEATTE